MTSPTHRFWTFSLVLVLGACASAPDSKPEKPQIALGESKASAIEVCRPSGQRAYLARLVCADGSRPTFSRLGSYGPRVDYPARMSKADMEAMFERNLSGRALQPGELDHHVVDGYEVNCGAARRVLFMDMYHCNSAPPDGAPPGFTLKD